ncbi:hypothetical protein CYPRO_0483 [Cyclonatronum proteinivorum]|uniref:Uncharacterized protein n=1 Tax=Cyclonatronum proteinivorum TaxID=1457365 RepID=A0A345UH17_9BACT|nr:hypothetical protein [Cyclonatronum proteinivorum]AXI99768.1 hypothetical protein CYPRO_0483 [Cyclonatronum proteinivorum]
MGQQQLLLVILVTIIVGIATVVAINIFGSSAEQANQDAVRQDMITMAAQAQAWYARPAMLGGGERDYQGDAAATPQIPGVSFAIVGFPCDGDNTGCINQNGEFSITAVTPDGFTLIGRPNTGDGSGFSLAVTGSSTNYTWGAVGAN